MPKATASTPPRERGPEMEYCVDRIEEGVAVLLSSDGAALRLPLSCLPEGTAEGAVLREEGGVFVPDEAQAEVRRAALLALQQSLLFEDGGA